MTREALVGIGDGDGRIIAGCHVDRDRRGSGRLPIGGNVDEMILSEEIRIGVVDEGTVRLQKQFAVLRRLDQDGREGIPVGIRVICENAVRDGYPEEKPIFRGGVRVRKRLWCLIAVVIHNRLVQVAHFQRIECPVVHANLCQIAGVAASTAEQLTESNVDARSGLTACTRSNDCCAVVDIERNRVCLSSECCDVQLAVVQPTCARVDIGRRSTESVADTGTDLRILVEYDPPVVSESQRVGIDHPGTAEILPRAALKQRGIACERNDNRKIRRLIDWIVCDGYSQTIDSVVIRSVEANEGTTPDLSLGKYRIAAFESSQSTRDPIGPGCDRSLVCHGIIQIIGKPVCDQIASQ